VGSLGPAQDGGVSAEPGFFGEVVEWFTDPLNWEGSFGIPARLREHLITSGVSVLIAALIALPSGMYIGHRRRFEFLVVSVANMGRAIPSFGLLFLAVLVLGLGLGFPAEFRPAIIIALVLLAIPPTLTNAYVGIQNVDPDTLEAARGMGMTEPGILRVIELPLAAPLIVGGLRTAAVQVVATATLAAVVGGGGLGRFILDGFATGDDAQIFGGAVLVALLAILTELAFALLERLVAPRTTTVRRRRERRPAFEHAAKAGQPGGGVPLGGGTSSG
jgi:osmoprotectant transport system permease protein